MGISNQETVSQAFIDQLLLRPPTNEISESSKMKGNGNIFNIF